MQAARREFFGGLAALGGERKEREREKGDFWRALEDSVARKERFWATVRDRYFSAESGRGTWVAGGWFFRMV